MRHGLHRGSPEVHVSIIGTYNASLLDLYKFLLATPHVRRRLFAIARRACSAARRRPVLVHHDLSSHPFIFYPRMSDGDFCLVLCRRILALLMTEL